MLAIMMPILVTHFLDGHIRWYWMIFVSSVKYSSSSIPGHAEAVISTSFSPSGKHLASGSGDTTVRFWDLHTQTPLHVCKGNIMYIG